MSTMRIALFGAVALLQIGVAGSMVWQHATTLTAGRVWKFRTAPVARWMLSAAVMWPCVSRRRSPGASSRWGSIGRFICV